MSIPVRPDITRYLLQWEGETHKHYGLRMDFWRKLQEYWISCMHAHQLYCVDDTLKITDNARNLMLDAAKKLDLESNWIEASMGMIKGLSEDQHKEEMAR